MNGKGRLLDLACGTGQISFAMHSSFDEIWAVDDQEPDMVGVAREKAERLGIRNIRFLISAAEDLDAPEEASDLVAIGNAFHRLRRETVARNALRWLRPYGCLALRWGESPRRGDAPWQQAMSATLDRWMAKAEVDSRIPPNWEQARAERPDVTVLEESGFEVVGSYHFPTVHRWTSETLIGFVYSTSFLSLEVLDNLAHDFEEDLRRDLISADLTDSFSETIDFAYELARRPA